jgi:hypothetical protein
MSKATVWWNKLSPEKQNEIMNNQPYIIYDYDDEEVFFTGTLEQCKEWWWNRLLVESNVGGYSLGPKK